MTDRTAFILAPVGIGFCGAAVWLQSIPLLAAAVFIMVVYFFMDSKGNRNE